MNVCWRSNEERILELLADQVTFGLSIDEQEELESLRVMMPDVDDGSLERAAATVLLASISEEPEPLPELLRKKIRHRASQS